MALFPDVPPKEKGDESKRQEERQGWWQIQMHFELIRPGLCQRTVCLKFRNVSFRPFPWLSRLPLVIANWSGREELNAPSSDWMSGALTLSYTRKKAGNLN